MKEIDIWMIRENLQLTFEERVAQHQNTLDLIDDLRVAIVGTHAEPPSPPKVPHSQSD